jgi:hypothetical protein
VSGGKVYYHIHWERVDVEEESKLVRKYEKVSGEPTDKLPEWASSPTLLSGYRNKDGDELPRYKNPVDEKYWTKPAKK